MKINFTSFVWCSVTMKYSNRTRSVLIMSAAIWTVIATGLLPYWPISFVDIDELAHTIMTEGSVLCNDAVKTLCVQSFVRGRMKYEYGALVERNRGGGTEVPCALVLFSKTNLTRIFETLTNFCHTTWRHIPADSILISHSSDFLRSTHILK